MHYTEYESYVVSLLKPEIANGDFHDKITYLHSKLINEAGELLGEVCKRDYHSKEVSDETLKLEAGDCSWYIFNLINLCENKEEIYEELDFMLESERSIDKSYGVDLYEYYRHWNLTIADMWQGEELCSERILDVLGGFLTIVSLLGFTFEEVLRANRDKLLARHGTSYNRDFYIQKS